MGRGSYLGGSTVIGPGSGWFSRSKGSKKKRNTKSAAAIEQDRKSVAERFLYEKVSAEILGKSTERIGVPKVFKREVEDSGGVEQWIESHPKTPLFRQRAINHLERSRLSFLLFVKNKKSPTEVNSIPKTLRNEILKFGSLQDWFQQNKHLLSSASKKPNNNVT